VVEIYGMCRRYPPSYDDYPVEAYTGFVLTVGPLITPGQWCGEWRAAEPQTVDDAAVVMARHVLTGDTTAARQLADKLIELIPPPVVSNESEDAPPEPTP
jgi:hypothetical protein